MDRAAPLLRVLAELPAFRKRSRNHQYQSPCDVVPHGNRPKRGTREACVLDALASTGLRTHRDRGGLSGAHVPNGSYFPGKFQAGCARQHGDPQRNGLSH